MLSYKIYASRGSCKESWLMSVGFLKSSNKCFVALFLVAFWAFLDVSVDMI